MKIELDYDPSTSEIKDPRYGTVIISWAGLESLEVKHPTTTSELSAPSKVSVAELKELKEAGYEAHEITELRRTGVI